MVMMISLLGPEFKIFVNGYKVNRRLFQAIMLFCFLYIALTVSVYGFELDSKFYYKCTDPLGCQNPFYNFHHIVHKCREDWCSREYLTMGTYGKPPPRTFSFFPVYVISLLALGIVGNHFTHNKGFKFERNELC
jgi:hypothetical protein